MAPSGNKRKRPERQASRDDGPNRPSPYRPQDTGLAQQGQQHSGSRGGRGPNGGGSRRPSRQMAQSPVNGGPARNHSAASPTPASATVLHGSPAVGSSKPATPPQTAIGPSLSLADETPKQSPAPYWYGHVTDAVVQSWKESGKAGIVEAAKGDDLIAISTILQELLRAGLDGRLSAYEAGSVVKLVVAQHAQTSGPDIQSLFLSTLSLLDESDTKDSKLLTLVSATDIDPDVIRHELDIPILQALALVRSTFTQMRTRKTTNLLYRQANFNLLREDTEGYAKLVTEYFNTANEATHDHTVSAERAFERITALVGSFDLDVGRVLDITLDISANLLVRAYGFFIKFYRCSSWWPDSGVIDNVKWEDQGFSAFPTWALPGANEDQLNAEARHSQGVDVSESIANKREARDVRFWNRVRDTGMGAFFELGMRRIVDFEEILPLLHTEVAPEYDSKNKEINADRRRRINENRKYMVETGMLPPSGNSDAAQLLGFKLRFYASSARDAQDVLPENLIFLAALLIKIGFISLRDLYPHLHPIDEKMSEEKTRLEKEKADKEAKERPGVASNALAMAGALTEDTLPVAARALRGEKERSGGTTPRAERREEDSKNDLPPPVNQKLQLLKALLLIGALPEALYILGRFPWLADVDSTLPPYLHRIANEMLSKVAASMRPLNGPDDAQISKDEVHSLVSRPDGTLLFQHRPDRKPTRWLGLDTVEKGDGLSYRHYYPDWNDNIPLCQSVDDVCSLCNTFLGYLGVKIGQDAKLLGTLVRVARYSLNEDFSQVNQSRWLDLMRRLLVPALSLSKHNAGLTQEVYELLKLFPTTTRYNIYAECYYGKTSRLPDMRVAFEHNKAEVKDVLRRVTNESGKKQARALAKVSFSSPGIVMMTMINQLESYSNMIPSLVECTRYFPLLAYDVLTWCLINSLSGRGRDRMQADGMLTSSWLQALSHFVASLFFRYTALNPTPVLQYLASELRAGNSTDLEMFEQLLAEMAGIRSDMEFNDSQVLAMAGGRHLQAQTVLQLADKRHDRKLQAQRLIKALSDPGLIGQMLISIAQERQMYPHHESSKDMPLKVLGNNFDKIQQVFAQYLDVLKTNLNSAEFEASVPNVVSLIAEFGLEPRIAFTICRFWIAQRMLEFDSAKKSELEEKKRRTSQERSHGNGDVEMDRDVPTANGAKTEAALTASASTHEEIANNDIKTTSTPQASTSDDEAQHWHPVLQPIIQQLSAVSPHLAGRVSIPFFVSFWTRSLQDILVHTASYDNEINKVRGQVKELSNDRTDAGGPASKEREKKKRALSEVQDKLRDELKTRIASYQRTRNRINRQEKDHWFARSMDREESDARHIGLLQDCFLPRAMFSSLDAHYCFLMLKILHDSGTPGFGTMRFLAQLFRKNELATLMFQCTAMEAQHFGRFLNETLKLLQHWHADRATYDREALGEKQKLPGFAKTLDSNGDPLVVLEYEEFRRLLYNWHSFLYGALQTCFESNDYMSIRNGIIVLKAIVQVFPSLNFHGNNMAKLVTKLSEEESRQDLKLAAMSLLGPLRNREKQWMLPQAFRLNDSSKEAVRGPEAPQPRAGTPKLSATAPEFKPISNGTGRNEPIAGKEDGEIEDEKHAAAQGAEAEIKNDAAPTAPSREEEMKEHVKNQPQVAMPKARDSEVTKEPAGTVAKPSTPASIPSKPPPPMYGRTESSRAPSTQPASTHSHPLPSRPPSKPLPALPGSERVASRYGGRDDSFGRLSRPNDIRPASRDHSPSRNRNRTPERDTYHGHSVPGRATPRQERGSSRNPRDDPRMGFRRDQPLPPTSARTIQDTRDRVNSAAPPVSVQGAHPHRASYTNSGDLKTASPQMTRQPLGGAQANESEQTDNQHHENPARLALINKDQPGSRDRAREPATSTEPRNERDPKDEHSRQSEMEISAQGISQGSDRPSDLAPSGPKHGSRRLSRDFGNATPPQNSSDRLNGSQDFTSGQRPPNGPSGRIGRAFPGSGPPSNARQYELTLPSPSTARPPESPAAFRPSARQAPDRRQSGQQFDRPSPASSVPTTPASENGPIHPSRLGQLEMKPVPIQTQLPATGPRNASSPTTAPPSAPRGATRPPVGTPTGPASATNGAPSGPASATERPRRPERRQIGSINATLQGTHSNAAPNGQSVNFRGAALNRQSGPPASSSSNPQTVQAVASPMEPPSRLEALPAERQDRSLNRAEPRADLFQSKQTMTQDEGRAGRPRRGEGDFSDRQRDSRHSSREPRPLSNAHPPAAAIDGTSRRADDRGARNDRESRDAGPQSDSRFAGSRHDDFGSRRPPAQGAPGSFSNQPANWERGGERRGQPRREGPGGSERSTRGHGQAEDFRREEERRGDTRMGRDSDGNATTRKRRHDEAPPFDEAKRRRSAR